MLQLKRLSIKIRRILEKPQYFFLLVSALSGFLLIFILPPYQAPDEHTHFYKSVQQSYGHIKAEKFSETEVGSMLPAKYNQSVAYYKYMWLDPTQKINPGVVKEQLLHGPNDSARVITKYENTAVYPPLTYIPQTIGLSIARVFHSSVLIQLYAARIATLLAWLVLTFFAIKIIPFGKWAMVALAITPLTLMLSASSSNDAVTFGLIFLWTSFCLKVINDKKPLLIQERNLLIVFSVILGLLKPPYFLLILLTILIPRHKFKGLKQSVLLKSIVITVPLITAILWMLFTRNLYIVTNPLADTPLQISYILSNLHGVSIDFLNTFFISPVSDDLVLQFYGLYSWLVIRIPIIFVVVAYISLFLVMTVRNPFEATINNLTTKIRIWLVVLYVLSCFAIIGLIFLSFNPVGQNEVIGLNSRYFIPLAVLFIPALSGLINLKNKSSYITLLKWIKPSLILLSIVTIVSIYLRFHIAN